MRSIGCVSPRPELALIQGKQCRGDVGTIRAERRSPFRNRMPWHHAANGNSELDANESGEQEDLPAEDDVMTKRWKHYADSIRYWASVMNLIAAAIVE